MWEAIFFYAFAIVAVVSALLMVLMKNPVVSAVYLVVKGKPWQPLDAVAGEKDLYELAATVPSGAAARLAVRTAGPSGSRPPETQRLSQQ